MNEPLFVPCDMQYYNINSHICVLIEIYYIHAYFIYMYEYKFDICRSGITRSKDVYLLNCLYTDRLLSKIVGEIVLFESLLCLLPNREKYILKIMFFKVNGLESPLFCSLS